MSKDYPVCPSCGKKLSYGMLRCDVCHMAIGAKTAGIHLSDKELSEKLMVMDKKQTMFIILGLILFCLIFLVFVFPDLQRLFALLFFLLLPFSGYLFVLAGKQRANMKKLIGLNAVLGVLNEAFELHEYIDSRHIDEKIIAATQLIPGWDECTGNDYVSGVYQGVGLTFSDIQLKHIGRGINKRKSGLPIFEGQWISCGLGKEFGIHMLIRERSKTKLARERKKTEHELMTGNAAFDERFQVITTDPGLALRFLTPHNMERIISVTTAANARMYFYIGGTWLHIAVNSEKELFEVGKSAELTDIPQLRARLKTEVDYIIGIVDELLKIENLFGS
ncbi:MAG: DUF3137 domain-containing protein [Clostridiales bacterium]|nr:DUF3137 domain-containing protein [Clostridiales bacterium]